MSDNQRHRIQVDHSEREAPLLELLRQSSTFDVRISRLTVGDYLINDEILIERKTIVDFAASLVDGRLFPQAARLARDGHRTLILIEGPRGIDARCASARRSRRTRFSGNDVAPPCASHVRRRPTHSERCSFWRRKRAIVANACFADTTESRSDWRLVDCFCFKACREWAQPLPHDC